MADQSTNPIDLYTQGLIRRKVGKLARLHVIPDRDREDIEQDLILELLRWWAKVDAPDNNLAPLIRVVIDQRLANILRHRRAACRRPDRASPLERLSQNDPALSRTDKSLDKVPLSLDIQELIRELPAELRRVAEVLQTESISSAACSLGISRGTVYARLRELRSRYERPDLRKFL